MGYELSYADWNGSKHINSVQEWQVKQAGGRTVSLQLAGFRRNGERNTFAMKHLLPESKKGTAADVKAEKKLMHRIDHGGNSALNPHGGAKGAAAHAQTRADKYGSAMNAAAPVIQNTVIDLGIVNLNTVVYTLAAACSARADAGDWALSSSKHLDVDFPSACVRHVTAALAPGNAQYTFGHTPLATRVRVQACRIDPDTYEVYHLG